MHIDSVMFINILPPVVSAHLKYECFLLVLRGFHKDIQCILITPHLPLAPLSCNSLNFMCYCWCCCHLAKLWVQLLLLIYIWVWDHLTVMVNFCSQKYDEGKLIWRAYMRISFEFWLFFNILKVLLLLKE